MAKKAAGIRKTKPGSRLASEQALSNVTKELAGKSFKTLAEINALLASLTNPVKSPPEDDLGPSSPREQAQDLAYEAMDTPTPGPGP